MAKKEKKGNDQDLSSFMPILMLTIGSLVFLLVVNTIIIMSNPENVRISSVVRSAIYVPPEEGGTGTEGGAPFPFGNEHKEPSYIDVYRDRLIVYPGGEIVPVRDLEIPGNAVERLLTRLDAVKDEEYVVLLVRPYAARIARRLRTLIKERGIDVGHELFESDREPNYEQVKSER
ncbi:MAG: hypothetical protein EOM20_14355 [Spartobacteria bacterium]|nr:hypothetical protein [Spartobacteria bacterium]